jgi:hypothetical protein
MASTLLRRAGLEMPDLSFQAMADGKPLRFNKRSWSGVVRRQQLLQDHGIEIPGEHVASRIGQIWFCRPRSPASGSEHTG